MGFEKCVPYAQIAYSASALRKTFECFDGGYTRGPRAMSDVSTLVHSPGKYRIVFSWKVPYCFITM